MRRRALRARRRGRRPRSALHAGRALAPSLWRGPCRRPPSALHAPVLQPWTGQHRTLVKARYCGLAAQDWPPPHPPGSGAAGYEQVRMLVSAFLKNQEHGCRHGDADRRTAGLQQGAPGRVRHQRLGAGVALHAPGLRRVACGGSQRQPCSCSQDGVRYAGAACARSVGPTACVRARGTHCQPTKLPPPATAVTPCSIPNSRVQVYRVHVYPSGGNA